MYPYLFGSKIPTYTVMIILGAVVAVIIAQLFLVKKFNLKRFDSILVLGFIFVGAYIGAVLFSILTNINELVSHNHTFIEWLTTGYVFYGGLLGGALGIFVYSKIFKINLFNLLDYAAVVLPLGQAFGRVGCLAAGCCFGKPVPDALSWLGISFPNGSDAYTTYGSSKLYPTQIIEVIYCLVLFVILFTLVMNNKLKSGQASFIYLLTYAICRFFNEFLRGDFRGTTGAISLSQYISIAIILALLVYLLVKRLKKSQKN